MIALLLLALVACAPEPTVEIICDGIDNDDDGLVDTEDARYLAPFHFDHDQDGYGDIALPYNDCEPELWEDVVELVYATDCDDEDPEVYPGARIVPGSGLDNNCDGWSE